MLTSENATTLNVLVDNRRKAEALFAQLSVEELRALRVELEHERAIRFKRTALVQCANRALR